MLNQCICALAHHGNVVIVGRGGFAVLADLEAFHKRRFEIWGGLQCNTEREAWKTAHRQPQ